MATKTKKRKARGMLTPGVCRVCGCTESDCADCVEDTFAPCCWTDNAGTLCSACVRLEPALKLLQRWADVDKASQTDGISTELFDDLHELAAALLKRFPLRGPKLLIGADYDWMPGHEMGESYKSKALYTASRVYKADEDGGSMYYELRPRKGRRSLSFEGGGLGPVDGFKSVDEAARWIAASENETRMLVAAGALDREE